MNSNTDQTCPPCPLKTIIDDKNMMVANIYGKSLTAEEYINIIEKMLAELTSDEGNDTK